MSLPLDDRSKMVRVVGFAPTASASQTRRAARLRHTRMKLLNWWGRRGFNSPDLLKRQGHLRQCFGPMRKWWVRRDLNPHSPGKSRVAYQLTDEPKMAGRMGLEPMISCVTGRCPNQTGPTPPGAEQRVIDGARTRCLRIHSPGFHLLNFDHH